MQSSLTSTQLPQSHHNSWQRAEPEQSVLYGLGRGSFTGCPAVIWIRVELAQLSEPLSWLGRAGFTRPRVLDD